MKNVNSEKGSVTVFVIVAFLFCMTILLSLYWTSTNDQVTVLQAEQRLKDTYGKDVNNVEEIYEKLQRNDENVVDDSTVVI